IFDEGQARPVTTFVAPPHPVAVTLLLDRSRSVAARSTLVTDAAAAFIDGLAPGDRVAVGALTRDCVSLTEDRAGARHLVLQGLPEDIGSPLWESIDRTLFTMTGLPERKVLVVLSDGQNSAAPLVGPGGSTQGASTPSSLCLAPTFETGATYAEVARRAEQSDVLVYGVGVKSESGWHDRSLRALARSTGGELFRLEDGLTLQTVFTSITAELHHQYLLGFEPPQSDGSSRRIDVRVRRGGVTVRARQRYARRAPQASTGYSFVPPASITEEQILQALEDGHAGRTLEAGCRVYVPGFDDGVYDVRVAGPLGRVMRAAREARGRGVRLSRADLTTLHTAPTVLVWAEGNDKVPLLPPVLDPTPVRGRPTAVATRSAGASRVKVRGVTDTPRILVPLDSGFPGPLTWSNVASFDLGEFGAIQGPVEVIVEVGPAEGRCRLRPEDVARVR
ncbi:MAG: hypothetical protein AB7L71_15475, partial [Vicinamibacterales bacterium]